MIGWMGSSRWLTPRTALLALAVAAPPVQFACEPAPQPTTSPENEVFTAGDGTRFRAEVVAIGLEVPWSLAFAPDGRAFVTERPGRVRVLVDGEVLPDPALTLPDTHAVGEAGVMGIALDPEFSSNGFVYLLYTRNPSEGLPPANRVVRYREVGNRLAEAVVLLDDIPAARFHDGGRLRFGPDGYLYVAMGDATDEDDAQELASPSGKIIRINKDGTTPASNPRALPVYSYGHRNPQGFDWHPLSGMLWATEHGNVGNDEVNVITAGANYGWPVIEGMETMPRMETPVLSFSPSIAPSGASFHVGNVIPAFRNDFFFAALRGEHLHRIRFDPGDPTRVVANERLLEGRFGRLRDVVTGLDGALYVLTNNRDGRGRSRAGDDRILRLVAAN